MTIGALQREEDGRDLITEAVAYLNSKWRGQEDMEQRIAIHLLDFCGFRGFTLEEPTPGEFIINATGYSPA